MYNFNPVEDQINLSIIILSFSVSLRLKNIIHTQLSFFILDRPLLMFVHRIILGYINIK